MGTFRNIVVGALATSMVATPVMAAAPVRPAAVNLPALQGASSVTLVGMRAGKRVARGNSLLGAPLFLVFLGAVAVTIGTIVIVNNSGSSSPQ